jgi:hypothetical protein
MQEMADPALSLNRARQTWQQHGRSDKWHMDCPAHDGAGNPQQTHRLLELFPNRVASTSSTAHDFLIK